ncbi:MAG: chromate transporter [Treponema sp.]|jgi:chromate transporter|nr:chromate transporter [Treponema sp.]
MKEYLELIWTFIKIGCMTFGGGYAMIPVLEREVMGKKNWVTMDEVMDYYTIAQITPGIIAVNTATFIGCKRKGPAGGIAATVSFLAPGMLIMIIVSVFIKRFAEYRAVQHVFAGIRIAVGALILDTLLKLLKGVFADVRAVVIFILAFCLQAVLSASPVLVVTGAGVAGFFLYRTGKVGPDSGGDAAGGEGGR